MMAIVLITERGQGAWLFDTLDILGKAHQDDPRSRTVDLGDGWLRLRLADDVAEEYDPEDLARVHERVTDPQFYVLQVNEPSLYNDYLSKLDGEHFLLIDNDHGWIDTIAAYKHAIAQGHDWLRTPSIQEDAPAS